MAAGPPKWELDSDEIASVTSEDLHHNRPNRWTGPKSTWRTLTQEERMLWESMKQLRDQDLAAHLYNAFALKRRGRDAKLAQDLTVRTEDGQNAVWAPPKIWTAWPLRERHLVAEGLSTRQDDEEERFTVRKEELTMPSSELQEELGALMLRLAKDRFRRRGKRTIHKSIEAEEPPGSLPSATSSPEPPFKAETDDDGEKMDLEEDRPTPAQEKVAETYEPVVTTDDEQSYKLLQPSVRHILSLLDKTLTILHHSRVACRGYTSDSTSGDESGTQDEKTPKKKGRRRRSASQAAYDETASSGTDDRPSASRRGRPRKVHTQREGESHDDMLRRIAREGHRRLPPHLMKENSTPKSADNGDQPQMADKGTTPESVDEDNTRKPMGKEAAFLEWLRTGDERMKREKTLLEKEARLSNAEKKLARWGLRDWSDVVGGAALAGFPEDVIARTTQRCTNLFGGGMVIRRLDEVPTSRGSGVRGTAYRPEQILLSDSDPDAEATTDESEDEVATALPRRRPISRQGSLARSGSDSDAPPRGRRSASLHARTPTTPPSTRSRSRSRSRSSPALFLCPVRGCDRAASGFARRANLRRHLELVHPGHVGGGGGGGGEDVDSDDEVVGAVHVDGFLRPIVPGKGWRGEDAGTRKRKRHYGQRPVAEREASANEDGWSS